jgi:hypothetical protein
VKEDQKRITVDLDAALFRRLKLHALLSDKTMTDIVRELVTRELAEPDNEGR